MKSWALTTIRCMADNMDTSATGTLDSDADNSASNAAGSGSGKNEQVFIRHTETSCFENSHLGDAHFAYSRKVVSKKLLKFNRHSGFHLNTTKSV